MRKDLSVLAIGEILFDVFNNDKKPGGSSMNVALHLHKQGIKTHFISAIGNDEDGEELIHYLKNQNFDAKYIQQHLTLPTSTVNVNLDKNFQASYVINQPVAWDDITLNKEVIDLVKNSSAMVYCSLTCRNPKSRNTIFELLNHENLKFLTSI
jgi:fructokinase